MSLHEPESRSRIRVCRKTPCVDPRAHGLGDADSALWGAVDDDRCAFFRTPHAKRRWGCLERFEPPRGPVTLGGWERGVICCWSVARGCWGGEADASGVADKTSDAGSLDAGPRSMCLLAGEAHRGRVSCRTGPVRRDVAPGLARLREPEARLDHHGPLRVGSVTRRSRARADPLRRPGHSIRRPSPASGCGTTSR